VVGNGRPGNVKGGKCLVREEQTSKKNTETLKKTGREKVDTPDAPLVRNVGPRNIRSEHPRYLIRVAKPGIG
jgi:hypothetical protein